MVSYIMTVVLKTPEWKLEESNLYLLVWSQPYYRYTKQPKQNYTSSNIELPPLIEVVDS